MRVSRPGQAVGGIEEQLLQRAGQVATPHQGRGRGQRMVLEDDPDPATISAVAERLLAAGARDLYAEGVDPGQCTARFSLTVERGDTGWRR